MITCTKCKVKQQNECFNTDKRKKNGLKSYCKTCQKNYDLIRYEKDPQGQRDRIKNYRKRIKETFPELAYISNRKASLKRNYGISLEQYNNLLKEQNGCCYICKELPSKKQLAVDHCHTTNKVRKLLCSKCNTALGLVNDNPEILKTMILYLTEK